MAKIIYSSDNHLNMNGIRSLTETIKFAERQAKHLNDLEATHYIINGDISWEKPQIIVYLATLEKHFDGIVRKTLGNHCLSQYLTIGEYINYDTKNYLPTHPIITDELIIIGNSGFFDLSFKQDYLDFMGNGSDLLQNIEQEVNSRYFKDDIKLENIPKILPKLLENSEHQLHSLLKNPENNNKKIVFVTHYMPNTRFVRKERTEQNLFKNIFMGSDLYTDFIETNKIDACYFGHTHRRISPEKFGNCTYYCNPLGTKREWEKWGYVEQDLFTQWQISLLEIK